MNQSSTRSLSTKEIAALKKEKKRDSLNMLTFAAVVGLVIKLGIDGTVGMINDLFLKENEFSVTTLSTTLSLLVFSGLIAFTIKSAAMDSHDIKEGAIETLRVKNPKVIEINANCNEGPILVFEISENQLLYLQGPWLEAHETYSKKEPTEFDIPEGPLGMLSYFNFPNTYFELHRLPCSGRVKKIEVFGDYIEPNLRADLLKGNRKFMDSEIFEGNFETFETTLKEEKKKC